MSFRGLASIASLLAGITLSSCSPTNSCIIDKDCAGTELCIDDVCVSGCVVDRDCVGTQICEAGECRDERSPGMPGTVGRCIETKVAERYNTCIMDAPQDFTSVVNNLTQNLDDIPTSFNLRNRIDGSCPPVHSQGQCGWCVPHAVTAAMEINECKHGPNQGISVPHLWSLGGGNVTDCKGGWQIAGAMDTAKNSKIVPDSVWSYSTDGGIMKDAKPSLSTLQSRGRHSIDGYQRVSKGDLAGIKSAIAEGYPVVYSLSIVKGAGWFYDEDKYPLIDGAAPNGRKCSGDNDNNCVLGYHALVLVGYDDSTQRFQLRNSWSDSWGDNGYASVSYRYVQEAGRGGAYPRKNPDVIPDPTCTPQATLDCKDGDAWYKDSCDRWDGRRESCTHGCTEGRCNGSSCSSRASVECRNGDAWFRDSCGSWENLKEDCANGCADGRCNSGGSCTASSGCPDSSCAFYDGFDGSSVERDCKWTVVNGNPHVSSGSLKMSSSDQVLTYGKWTCPAKVEYKVKVTSGLNSFVLDDVLIGVTPNELLYNCNRAGVEPISFSQDFSTFKTVRLEVSGNEISVYVNNSLAGRPALCTNNFSTDDVAILSHGSSNAEIDYVKVKCR
jgi:C1A family cysteine protease